MTKVLACIDASSYATSVTTLAAWASHRLRLPVEILHVLQRRDAASTRNDLSGAIGLGAKGDLLEELTRISESEGRLAIERGRVLLAQAEEWLAAAGATGVSAVLRHGGIVETIADREAEAELVVIGKRGASGQFATEHLGSKLERVARGSTRPVLVAPRQVAEIDTAVLAVDGSPSASRALDYVSRSKLFEGMELHVVSAGPAGAKQDDLLAGAVARLAESGRKAVPFAVPGRPEEAIAAHIERNPGSLLVMGSFGHAPLRALIIGSTTTAMLRTVHVPILLVR
ncbi:MAG: universal stress protein [Bauldia sp.]|nr:universal stress protein [Bauldia sp.]